jgi:hypothetical protein
MEMIYRETYTTKGSGGMHWNREMYFFDIGLKYILSVGPRSRGMTERYTWKEIHIPYNKDRYEDYELKEVSVREVKNMYLKDLIEYVFERFMEK